MVGWTTIPSQQSSAELEIALNPLTYLAAKWLSISGNWSGRRVLNHPNAIRDGSVMFPAADAATSTGAPFTKHKLHEYNLSIYL